MPRPYYWMNIYKDNKKVLADLLIRHKEHPHYELESITPDTINKNSKLLNQIPDRFPGATIVWKRIRGMYKDPVVADITLPGGRFFITRNGNNAGIHNMAILDASKGCFYFTGNVQSAIDLVEILGCERNNLPLLMARIKYPKLLGLIEQRLKED